MIPPGQIRITNANSETTLVPSRYNLHEVFRDDSIILVNTLTGSSVVIPGDLSTRT